MRLSFFTSPRSEHLCAAGAREWVWKPQEVGVFRNFNWPKASTDAIRTPPWMYWDLQGTMPFRRTSVRPRPTGTTLGHGERAPILRTGREVYMTQCIFCDNELTQDNKPEHMLLNALGGRRTTRTIDCSICNAGFGSTIDNALAAQVAVIRNMLQLDSGSGRAPPMLRNIPSGNDVINITNDGTPELVAKPFTVRKREDGTIEVGIMAKSPEDAARHIPHIAAQVGCSEEELLQKLASGTGSFTARRPDVVHHPLSFGGPLAVRSIAKSCLVLWASAVGNEEVKSAPYDGVRRFVVSGDDTFDKARVHLDSRYLPHTDELARRFGAFFNLIYVASDDSGRVLAHFTLYNIISWHVVVAKSGAIPNTRIALVSNPLDPSKWSDSIADELPLDFPWLDSPDYTDQFVRARERFTDMMKHYVKTETPRELTRIADEVFRKHGIMSDDEPITNPELRDKILGEISQRFALHALGLPYVESLTGEQVVALIKEARGRAG